MATMKHALENVIVRDHWVFLSVFKFADTSL